MKTRSEILMSFYKKIDEELYVLKNGFDVTNTKLIASLETIWDHKNLDALIAQLETLKKERLTSFITSASEDELEANFDLEIAIIRINVLAVLIRDLLDYLETDPTDPIYQAIEKSYGYYQLDTLTLTSLFKVGQSYIKEFYHYMRSTEVFSEAADFFKYIQKPIQQLIVETDFFIFFEQLADLFESIMNFLERIGEAEFDWDVDEQHLADDAVYTISILQWSIYFLLLLKQDATREMELRTHYKFQKNTDVIDERDDYLHEIEIWKNLK